MSKDKTGKALERQVADLYRALGAWKGVSVNERKDSEVFHFRRL
jgi:hypothetical protein